MQESQIAGVQLQDLVGFLVQTVYIRRCQRIEILHQQGGDFSGRLCKLERVCRLVEAVLGILVLGHITVPEIVSFQFGKLDEQGREVGVVDGDRRFQRFCQFVVRVSGSVLKGIDRFAVPL